jgi:hypothetical protein
MDRGEAHERLVDDLLLALSATGVCRVWRQPTGAAFRDDRLVRYGTVGSADISGVIRGGTRLEVEVKTGRGVQSKNQLAFEKMITAMGGLYIVARDVETVVNRVKESAK